MKSANCRYCGKQITFGADIDPRKDMEAINGKIVCHEISCEHNPDRINVPECSTLKNNGKKSIKCSELNPSEHFENAMVNIHNLIVICRELEELDAEAQCTNIVDEVNKLRKILAQKYRWS